MKAKLIKSPLNYIRGKYKLSPQILPLFPEKNRVLKLKGGLLHIRINK